MARKTSFYYSFLVLPRDQRRAIVAVWDFCRAVDDAVDEMGQAGSGCGHAGAPSAASALGWRAEPTRLRASRSGVPGAEGLPRRSSRDLHASEGGEKSWLVGREAICFWRAELARCYENRTPETPQGRALQPFIARFDLPRDAFGDMIDGVAMDLDTARYETFTELLQYCRRVASAVGMICIHIFECRSEQAREYALNLGIALQLTNIIRDVKDDLSRGRVYLPLEDLAAAGCTVDDLAVGRLTPAIRRLLEFECRRARDFYRRAAEARSKEDRGRLVAAEIMRAVYFETLRRIERGGYDVFSGRARVPRPKQALIAMRQWLWPR
jgi:phytoene synthase